MKISPISYAIHDDGDSRVFGESVTVVKVNMLDEVVFDVDTYVSQTF